MEGGGSPLFMLNVHMWKFGRPQARTVSVQERWANKERAQKAANLKRAQRKPYTQEKAERRRAMGLQLNENGAACSITTSQVQ